MIKSSLSIRELALSVFLGWPEEERQQRQTILVNIELQFQQPPTACQSDDLQEAICYDTLTQLVQHYVKDKSFRLVEYLAGELYLLIKKELNPANVTNSILVKIEIAKQPATVAKLNGGICFRYGDFA